MPIKSRSETNWEVELTDQDISIDKGTSQKVVLLKGLRRLSRLAGIMSSYPTIQHAVTPTGKGLIQCVYHLTFDDGTTWGAAADVSQANCNQEPYSLYPTAMAEARAEGRAIKKALGINMLVAEEISGASQSERLDPQVSRAISELIVRNKETAIRVIQNAVATDRQDHVHGIEDLTAEEGRKALEWLNSGTAKGSSKVDKRTDRKRELEERMSQK